IEPALGPDEMQAAMDSIVDPLLSGPVLVVAGQTEVEVTVEELSEAATLQTENGDFTLTLDGTELDEVLTNKADTISDAPQDARHLIPGTRWSGENPPGSPESTGADWIPSAWGKRSTYWPREPARMNGLARLRRPKPGPVSPPRVARP